MGETVASVMTVPVDTVGPDETLQVALERLSGRGCRELPVVQNGRLVGMLTERDLRSALAGDAAAALARPVSFAMSPEVWTVPATAPLSAACARLAAMQVGAMPVVDGQGALCGILSVTDLLRVASHRFQRDGD